jgi:hypothetical protein
MFASNGERKASWHAEDSNSDGRPGPTEADLVRVERHDAEPPTVDAEYVRVSYTQFEFLYARSQRPRLGPIYRHGAGR